MRLFAYLSHLSSLTPPRPLSSWTTDPIANVGMCTKAAKNITSSLDKLGLVNTRGKVWAGNLRSGAKQWCCTGCDTDWSGKFKKRIQRDTSSARAEWELRSWVESAHLSYHCWTWALSEGEEQHSSQQKCQGLTKG